MCDRWKEKWSLSCIYLGKYLWLCEAKVHYKSAFLAGMNAGTCVAVFLLFKSFPHQRRGPWRSHPITTTRILLPDGDRLCRESMRNGQLARRTV